MQKALLLLVPRRLAMWLVLDGPRLPEGWAPVLFEHALGKPSTRVEQDS